MPSKVQVTIDFPGLANFGGCTKVEIKGGFWRDFHRIGGQGQDQRSGKSFLVCVIGPQYLLRLIDIIILLRHAPFNRYPVAIGIGHSDQEQVAGISRCRDFQVLQIQAAGDLVPSVTLDKLFKRKRNAIFS